MEGVVCKSVFILLVIDQSMALQLVSWALFITKGFITVIICSPWLRLSDGSWTQRTLDLKSSVLLKKEYW